MKLKLIAKRGRLRKSQSNYDEILRLKEQGELVLFEESLHTLYQNDKNDGDRAFAGFELALLKCQFGLTEEADLYLGKLGFKWKLGNGIWKYNCRNLSDLRLTDGLAACFDNILPSHFFDQLKLVFSPNSIFWKAHGYPTETFFSYNLPLNPQEEQVPKKNRFSTNNIIHQLALYLHPLICASFPDAPPLESVEWWAHIRDGGSAAGHRVRINSIRILFFVPYLNRIFCPFIYLYRYTYFYFVCLIASF
jgi:hypothetical protein